MGQTRKQRAMRLVVRVVVPLLAGLVVLLLLYPVVENEPIPPQCFSIALFSVPCDDGLNVAAGAATAAVVALALWWKDRRVGRPLSRRGGASK